MPFYRIKTHTEAVLGVAKYKTTLAIIEDDETLPEMTYDSIRGSWWITASAG
jgi:hypothetical protein